MKISSNLFHFLW